MANKDVSLGRTNNPDGRPTKKTKALLSTLLSLIARGGPYELCCQAVGISRETFCVWRREDPAFADQVEKAAAKGTLERLGKIEKHGGKDWRALNWMLATRFPEYFALRPDTQVNVSAQAGVINGGAAGQNFQQVVVTDLEFVGLQRHPMYRHEPCVCEGVATEVSGSLVREGNDIVVISQSQKESRLQRAQQIRAKTLEMFAAHNQGNVSREPGEQESASQSTPTPSDGRRLLSIVVSAAQEIPPSVREFFESED